MIYINVRDLSVSGTTMKPIAQSFSHQIVIRQSLILLLAIFNYMIVVS